MPDDPRTPLGHCLARCCRTVPSALNTGVYAPSGGDPHADQEAMQQGSHAGAAHGEPGAAPASAADRACEQQCEALSHCQRPDPCTPFVYSTTLESNMSLAS